MFSAVYWHITFLVISRTTVTDVAHKDLVADLSVLAVKYKEIIEDLKCDVVRDRVQGNTVRGHVWRNYNKWDAAREVEETVDELSFTRSGGVDKWQS